MNGYLEPQDVPVQFDVTGVIVVETVNRQNGVVDYDNDYDNGFANQTHEGRWADCRLPNMEAGHQ